MGIRIEGPASGPMVVEVVATFAPEDALRIHDMLCGNRQAAVDLDFHRVRECQAAALALLARDLIDEGARVALHGMPRHPLRLLGYLGVPLDERPHDGQA